MAKKKSNQSSGVLDIYLGPPRQIAQSLEEIRHAVYSDLDNHTPIYELCYLPIYDDDEATPEHLAKAKSQAAAVLARYRKQLSGPTVEMLEALVDGLDEAGTSQSNKKRKRRRSSDGR